MLNELSWKLAYLNPRILAGKKNLLQRALDVYRTKFMPSLQPRRQSCRAPPSFDKVEKKKNMTMIVSRWTMKQQVKVK
ncbi:hypothetical protein G6F68_019316 [Rhizopus microsporus]|nr:hypothetical protein G6F68_019316 [Rhizopus microsporus]